jgi:hypothetical protein
MAHEASGVYEFAPRRMKQRYRNDKRVRGRCIETDGGYFTISLPQISPSAMRTWQTDPLARAENFFQVAVHEWGHIRDYQHGGAYRMAWAKRGNNARRMRWADRPEEKRAIRYTTEGNERIEKGIVQSPDNDILQLALWLDGNQP